MNITIVGAGVVGLTTAIRLCEAGHTVRIIAAQRTPHVTSNRAGAVYTPFRAEGDERTRRWTEAAYAALCELADRGPRESGVSMTMLREYVFTSCDGRPWWAASVRDFRAIPRVPDGYAAVYEARVPRMAMASYMPWLERRATTELGASITVGRVESLQAAFDGGAEVVVNCTGLGARKLAGDERVRPMRGQILHIPTPPELDACVVEESRDGTATYIFPFQDYTVLGGTYERDEWNEVTQPDALDGIISRCRALLKLDGYQGWAEVGSQRLRALAGLRPVRVAGTADEDVRLEREAFGRGRWVIHNYGHGRAGVTFSWACATDVTQLVSEVA